MSCPTSANWGHVIKANALSARTHCTIIISPLPLSMGFYMHVPRYGKITTRHKLVRQSHAAWPQNFLSCSAALVMQIAVYALQPRPECLEGRENGDPLARESCGVFTGTISISRVFGWVRGISVIKARPINLCRGRVYYIYDAKGCLHTHTHTSLG